MASSTSAREQRRKLKLALIFSLLSTVACGEGAGESVAGSNSSASSRVPSAAPAPAPTPSPSASAEIFGDATAGAAVIPPPAPLPKEDVIAKDLATQREDMLERMGVVLKLDDASISAVREILAKSKIIGQGNPDITKYAMTRAECRERRTKANAVDEPKPLCKAELMVPIGAKGGKEAEYTVCIDRYEFPNVPCDYPVTWASAREASQLCKAVGKRLCDAHEWEGACAGSVLPPDADYTFGKPRKESKNRHNTSRERVWAYGSERSLDVCGMSSAKSETCRPSGYKKCGSNSYPAGTFPACKSSFGVYDQHGNVAEHMNLPLDPKQLGSAGGAGETEMKGSWFIFKKFDAHEDDCRWRAPDWHVTKLMSHDSHQNYHLGFRCCKDIAAVEKAP